MANTSRFISTHLSSLNMRKVIRVDIIIPCSQKCAVKVFGDKGFLNNISFDNSNCNEETTFSFILNDYQQNYFIEMNDDKNTLVDSLFHFCEKNRDFPKFTVKKKVVVEDDEETADEEEAKSEKDDTEYHSDNSDCQSAQSSASTKEPEEETSKESEVKKALYNQSNSICKFFKPMAKPTYDYEEEVDEVHYIQATGKPPIVIGKEESDDEEEDIDKV